MTKPKGKNAFGGGNESSLYVPMSETEQEVIARLIESQNLRVIIHGWGVIEDPKISAGDKRISIPISVGFHPSGGPILVHSFELELATKTGITLFREKQSALYDGKPVLIEPGTEIQMIWDIGIRNMDPKVVKAILPSALGLTSRMIDKETGRSTTRGNYKGLDAGRQRLLETIRRGEEAIRSKKS